MSFAIKMNLSDAKVRTGGMTDMEPGVYVGKTTACEPYNNGKSVKFTVDCGEAGECEIYLGTDVEKQGNRNGWLTALVSHGKNVDKIKAAGAEFVANEKFFLGNTCYVVVRKVDGTDDQGRPLLNDKAFLPKDRYEAMKNVKPKAIPAASNGATTAAQPAATPAAQPAGTSGAALFD